MCYYDDIDMFAKEKAIENWAQPFHDDFIRCMESEVRHNNKNLNAIAESVAWDIYEGEASHPILSDWDLEWKDALCFLALRNTRNMKLWDSLENSWENAENKRRENSYESSKD